jgi:hypothetical protein
VAVLYVRGAVGLEVEGLLPVECHRLQRVDAEEGVLDRSVPHNPRYLLFLLLGQVGAAEVHRIIGELLGSLHNLLHSDVSPEAATHLHPWWSATWSLCRVEEIVVP